MLSRGAGLLNRREFNGLCGALSWLPVVSPMFTGLPSASAYPGVHVNYAETVLPLRDGLPKFKDFPAEFGGSGEQIAE